MSDIEMSNLRNTNIQSNHPRYQHLYSAGNGFWKDRLEHHRVEKNDGQEKLMVDNDDVEGEDGEVITVRNGSHVHDSLWEFHHPLDVSTISGHHPAHSSTLACSSMSSSHCSANPMPIVDPATLQMDTTESVPTSDPPQTLSIQDQQNGAIFEITEDTVPPPRPTRSQVLHYFARAHNFTLKRVGKDMQITDHVGFPLFDAYMETDCCGRTWTIETYGRLVLIMYEPMNSWCQDLARPRITIRDWNGDYFGLLLPGDPYYLHANDNSTIAKMSQQRSINGLGVIEEECNETTISPTINAVAPASLVTKNTKCWLCVHEGSGRHIARLEDYHNIQYNKEVAFQLKLLTLAGIVRLCGQSQLSPTSNCIGVFKTVLNCCAGY